MRASVAMAATNNGFRVGVRSLKHVHFLSFKKTLICFIVILEVVTAETHKSTDQSVAARLSKNKKPVYWTIKSEETNEILKTNSEFRGSGVQKSELGEHSYSASVKPETHSNNNVHTNKDHSYDIRIKRHSHMNNSKEVKSSKVYKRNNDSIFHDSSNVSQSYPTLVPAFGENENVNVETIDKPKVNIDFDIDKKYSIEMIKVSDIARTTADKIAEQLQSVSLFKNIEKYTNGNLKKSLNVNAPHLMTYNASDLNPNGLVVLNDTSNSTVTVTSPRNSINMPAVPKCCPLGQNLSQEAVVGERRCISTNLTFNPLFYDFNDTVIWEYETNEWQPIVGNPCPYDRYKLDTSTNSNDAFYLLVNGSILAPYQNPQMLSPRDYCLETFWNDTKTGGVTLPLVCFTTPPTEQAAANASFIAYAVGLIISVPFLLATALSYLLIGELRNNHGMALSCHCLCLALAFSCLATTQLAGHRLPTNSCLVVAFLIQFSFVASFFWLNVMCFDTWLIITHHLSEEASLKRRRYRFVLYSAYAWILPLALLVVSMVMDLTPTIPSSFLKPNFATSGCWFQTEQSALPYFYGPVGILLGSNVILFILTALSLSKHKEYMSITQAEITMVDQPSGEWIELELPRSPSSDWTNGRRRYTKEDQHENLRYRWKRYRKLFWMVCMLFLVMGLSWALDIISWLVGGPPLVWSIIDAINSLQGILIFIIFVLQDTVRVVIWRKIKESCCCCRKRKGNGMVSEKSSFIYESADGFM